MKNFSRVNKNKELYHDIIQDDQEKLLESSLKDYEQRVNKLEKEEPYQASRLKKNEAIDTQIEDIELGADVDVEDPIKSNETVLKKDDLLADKDLLADFIEEVKHYNINKGLRTVQDTQMNILHNLSHEERVIEEPKTNIKQEVLVEEYPQEDEIKNTVSELTQEIQAIIQDLDSNYEVVDNTIETKSTSKTKENIYSPLIDADTRNNELESVFNEIETSALMLSDAMEKSDVTVTQEQKLVPEKRNEETGDFKSNELLELTQTLNLKLDLQESESDEEDNHEVSSIKPNVALLDKFLTFVIILLTLALVAFIIFGIIWVSKGRGL